MWSQWYGKPIVKFNINYFAVHRESAWRYKRPGDGDDLWLRSVLIYSMEDVEFIMNEFFKTKKTHFYVSTNRYDWRITGRHPTRFVGQKEWRRDVFKNAEEEGGFVTGKDAVFEIDCAGHDKRAWLDDWEKGIRVSQDIVKALPGHGIKKAWPVFSGSGGIHIWVPWDQLQPLYEDTTYFKEHGMDYAALGEFAKEFVAEVVFGTGGERGERRQVNLDGIPVDVSPNTKRGLIRCPYSIHPKTEYVVLPLSKYDFWNLKPEHIDKKFSIKSVLRNIGLKNRGMLNVL